MVSLQDADYAVLASDASQRKLPGTIPPWVNTVDEAWLVDSFIEGELQPVRDYYIDVAPSRKRKTSSLSPLDPEPTPSPAPPAPKKGRPAKRRAPPEPEPEPEIDIELDDDDDMPIEVDDSDDESYVGSDDAGGPVKKDEPSDADIVNVWCLIDELRKWDKKGQLRAQLEDCPRRGIPNARKLYYTYKGFIQRNVPDLRARKPYRKRARVQ